MINSEEVFFITAVIPAQAGILKLIALRFPIDPIAIGLGMMINGGIN